MRISACTCRRPRSEPHATCLSPPAGEAQTICLDVAGGTGDIAFRIVDRLKQPFNRPLVPPHVIVCDINPAMLKVGQQRAVQLGYAGERPEGCLPWLGVASPQRLAP